MNTPDENMLLGRIAYDLIRLKRRNVAIIILAAALVVAVVVAVVA